MMFNDVDKSKPHTVLMVAEPVRLACLSFAGLARGVYYIQGDFRSKITKVHDKRLVEAKLIALRFVSDTEKPEEFAATDAIRADHVEPIDELPPSSGVDASPPVEMVPIIREPQITSQVQVVASVPTSVVYDPAQAGGWSADAPAVITRQAYAGRSPAAPPAEVVALPAPVQPAAAAEPEHVPTEIVADPQHVGEAPFVVPSEPPLVCATEVTPPDSEPIVILNDPPKKRRGRKLKQGNAIAPAEGEAKLTEHEQDRGSSEPAAAAPEDSLPNESSQALA